MTDKQIIIDETKCPWFNDGSCDLFYSDKEECWYRQCKDTPNCYYRETQTQLKRKEQEFEELKNKTFRYEELLKHSAMAQNTYTAEELNTIASGIKFVGNSLIAEENIKLHKTLTEIKEIAEHCIKQDICTTCDNSDKCHIEDEEIPTYDVCKLILQKISEVVK